jgi:hypothetical protein
MKNYLQCMKGTSEMKTKDVTQGLIHVINSSWFLEKNHDLNVKIFNLITWYCDCKIKIGFLKLKYNKVICKVTFSFTPYPIFQWYPQSKEIFIKSQYKMLKFNI